MIRKPSKSQIVLLIILLLVGFLLYFALQKQRSNKDLPSATVNTPQTAASLPAGIPSPSAPTPVRSLLNDIDQETWSYYKEIALLQEFGTAPEMIKKWTQPIVLYIGAYATEEDLVLIGTHIEALQEIPGIPQITQTDRLIDANMTIMFVTQAQLDEETAKYEESSFGFTRIWWASRSGEITKAEIQIVWDEQTQAQRNHTILEEVTQALGLMNDSERYADSIFYVHYSTDITALSDLDWTLVRIHYDRAIAPGLNPEVVEQLYVQYHGTTS